MDSCVDAGDNIGLPVSIPLSASESVLRAIRSLDKKPVPRRGARLPAMPKPPPAFAAREVFPKTVKKLTLKTQCHPELKSTYTVAGIPIAQIETPYLAQKPRKGKKTCLRFVAECGWVIITCIQCLVLMLRSPYEHCE